MNWKQSIGACFLLVFPTIIAVVILQLITRAPLFTLLHQDLANAFLATIAEVLAGILAIVFSVSVLAVEIASDKYTSRLFSYFIGNRITWLAFAALLVCILVSIIGMGIQTIPMYQWGFLIMSGSLTFCLMVMVLYSQHVFRLLDPRNLARRIRDDGAQAVEKQDPKKFKEAITSLGDVAIKSFERGEDEIAQSCLNVLQEMQQDFINTGSVPAFWSDRESVPTLFGFGIPSPVVSQYYRVFRIAAHSRNEALTQHIARLLYGVVTNLIEQGGSEQIFQGILLQQYHRFVEIAIENKDISRFWLVRSLRNVLFSRSLLSAIDKAYLSSCLRTLREVNEMIVQRQDFDLWKKELEYFSSISSLEEQHQSLFIDSGKLLSNLLNVGISIDRNQWEQWHRVAALMITRITSGKERIFELCLSEVEQLIPESMPEHQGHVQSIRQALSKLQVTTAVYDTFFLICVYALFQKRYDYVKELWRYVNPPDADAHWVNTNLIYLNAGFLIHQMVYYARIPWDIEGYHGSEGYVRQYFLICLAHVLQQGRNDWHPQVFYFDQAMLDRGGDYLAALQQELRDVHTFLVNLSYHADKVVAYYDTVAQMRDEWNDVFDGRASEAFAKARDWLINAERREEWKRRADSLLHNLPLDDGRVAAYRSAALEYYQKQSQVSQLAMTEDKQEKNPTELRMSCSAQCPEKIDFTLIGLGRPEEIGMRVGFEAVARIIKAEKAHIHETLLKHKATKPVKMKLLTYRKVVELAGTIREAGYEATVLLAPYQQITLAWQNDPEFRTHIIYEDTQQYLRVDGSTKLRVFEIEGEHVFVLDKRAGNWKTVTPLKVEVVGCERKPLAVQTIAQQVIDYQVLNPEAVGTLRLKSSRKRNPVTRGKN